MRVVTKRLMTELYGICYKVAIYIGYLHIKFDDEMKKNSLELQAQFLISLNSKYTDVYVGLYLHSASTFRYVRYMIRRPHRDGAKRKQHCMGRHDIFMRSL